MTKRCLIVALLILVTAGCSEQHGWTPPVAPPWTIPWQPSPPPPPPSLTVHQLLASPDSLVIDGTTISVQAFLNRDFMPFGPPEGKPLAAIVDLGVLPPATFPAPISAVYLWAVRDSSDVWSATMIFQTNDPTRNGAGSYWAGNGPLWDPDIRVDVVVGARTSSTTVSLVLLRDVLITKSY